MSNRASRRRAALYMRVSTGDGRQTTDNQALPLHEWCAQNDYTIVCEYIEHESGAEEMRPQFRQLMADAAARRFDIVLCWSVDRFSRQGLAPTLKHIERLREHGVEFYSHQEPFLRTMGPMSDLMLAFLSFMARFERDRKRERVLAGLARARTEGKTLGRRRIVLTDEQRAKLEQLKDKPLTEIAAATGMSRATVQRRLKEIECQQQEERGRNSSSPSSSTKNRPTAAAPPQRPKSHRSRADMKRTSASRKGT